MSFCKRKNRQPTNASGGSLESADAEVAQGLTEIEDKLRAILLVLTGFWRLGPTFQSLLSCRAIHHVDVATLAVVGRSDRLGWKSNRRKRREAKAAMRRPAAEWLDLAQDPEPTGCLTSTAGCTPSLKYGL